MIERVTKRRLYIDGGRFIFAAVLTPFPTKIVEWIRHDSNQLEN